MASERLQTNARARFCGAFPRARVGENALAPVIQKVDNAFRRINRSPTDRVSKTNAIYSRVIYPVDSVIHPSSNWGLLDRED